MKKRIKLNKIRLWHVLVFVLVVLIVLILHAKISTKPQAKIVREPIFAGTWYPGDKATLEKTIDAYFSNIKQLDFNGTVKAIIVPHAGYVYSGQIAAVAFKQINENYDTVFILGPSHQYPLQKASIGNYTYYKTPLGEIEVSHKAKDLLKEDIVSTVPQAHEQEHSIEIELPFLQKKIPDLKIVPIVVGQMDASVFKDTLLKYLGKNDLIVVSADMSHYHPYEDAKKLDAFTIDKILQLDSEGIFSAEIDAPWAVATVLQIAKEKNWKPILLYYANSGDVTGDKSSVVGYSATVFIGQQADPLTKEEQATLLNLARTTLDTYIKTGKKPNLDTFELTDSLKKVQGCFTTLNKNNMLRGCIGHILPQEELYKCVMDNAINAAVNDPRFQPVIEDELDDIDIEISVLTVPQKLDFSSGEDLENKLRPIVDGVVLKRGFFQSTYLPQVWEQLPDKDLFLSNLCQKGGMSADCWKDTSTEVYTYQAFVFAEN